MEVLSRRTPTKRRRWWTDLIMLLGAVSTLWLATEFLFRHYSYAIQYGRTGR